MKNKNILIYWTSRTFIEVIVPLLNDFSNYYNIYIILYDYSTPKSTNEIANKLLNDNIICHFKITPHYKKIARNFIFMNRESHFLQSKNFDCWISDLEFLPNQRFIIDSILPKHCSKIIIHHNITGLFMNDRVFVNDLLNGRKSKPSKLSYRKMSYSKKKRDIQFIVRSIFSKKLFRKMRLLMRRFYKKIDRFKFRILYPFIFQKKFLKFGEWDNVTQLGSGKCDAYIFFDELEVKVHQLLFNNSKVCLARYPTNGLCKCIAMGRKYNILSNLSSFVGDQRIDDKALSLYLRDYKIILDNTEATSIHLRAHPDETGKWHFQLRDFLNDNGVNAVLTEPDKPLRDIACEYIGVAGSASSSLRDCRAICDNMFVIGFVAISKYDFDDPKFVFANSDGIGWIEEDGSFESKIFNTTKENQQNRKSIIEIANELV